MSDPDRDAQDARRYRFIRENRPKDWQWVPGEILDRVVDEAIAEKEREQRRRRNPNDRDPRV